MTRRECLLGFAGWAAVSTPRTAMGLGPYSFPQSRRSSEALEFLEYARSLGAGGAQVTLKSFDSDYLKQVREYAERWGMYVEVDAPLPKDDSTRFEALARAAREIGALCLRTVCLGGRRYEVFSSPEQWKQFVGEAKERLRRALKLAEKYRVPLAVENHKDWTLEEMVTLLKEFGSEYLGACVDFGNNIALLDDPTEVVEGLAPYAMSTHVKDMAVEECAEGFWLAEVPLGEGFLDLPRLVGRIRQARPQIRFSLEMITRNPLKVPCLTDQYWASFPERPGRCLARTLSLVRAHPPSRPLPRLDELDEAARRRLELENVLRCLDYARQTLGLVT